MVILRHMNQYKTVGFYTLGCKLNFAETSTIARDFSNAGYAKIDFLEGPDIAVINTCSVTDNADKKCRQLIQKAKGINPHTYVIVIGCYAQLKPKEIGEIPGVNLVLGANEKFNVLNYIEDETVVNKVVSGEIKEVKGFEPSYSLGDRTRTFLKVQDGCDYFCSFCTIPMARGRSRSGSIEQIINIAKDIAATAVKEVVLTGVNIGDFGNEKTGLFIDLIKELDKIEGINRFRISSIEPNLLTNEIIDFVASSQRFMPHFHIPLQSGSDKILGAMRRKYRKELYQSRVEYIKQVMPDCCIGVDVIVGFPGETEEDFLETYEFLQNLDVSYLHVFTYSERANTQALKINDIVPWETRTQRSKMLRILSEKKKRLFYETQQGKTFDVLFEAKEEDGHFFGFTQNYVKVKIPVDEVNTNQVRSISLETIETSGIYQGKTICKESVA